MIKRKPATYSKKTTSSKKHSAMITKVVKKVSFTKIAVTISGCFLAV